MKNIKIGVISDLHLYKKTIHIERALSKLQDAELLLIIGDIADRSEEKQYDILLTLAAVSGDLKSKGGLYRRKDRR